MDEQTAAPTGEELYRRFIDGDESAFEELVGLYRDCLTKYIYRFVNDPRDAEELMIDSFAELAVGGRFRGQSSVKTYLFSVGRNITLKFIKKYRRRDGAPADTSPETAGYGDAPEMDFMAEEQRTQINSFLQSLKTEYREVLHFIYFENMSYAETGAVMRKTVKQVGHLTRRAKATLKTMMENEGVLYAKR